MLIKLRTCRELPVLLQLQTLGNWWRVPYLPTSASLWPPEAANIPFMWLLQVPSYFFYSYIAASVGSALDAWSCSEWLKKLFPTLSPCFQRSHLGAYCCLSATAKATQTSLPGSHLYFLLALQYPTHTFDWCVLEKWKGRRGDSRTHRGGTYRHVLPETCWLQVNGQIVKCSSDLYPDCCWKCWGLSKTVSYASCVCFPGSTRFPDCIFGLDSISTHHGVTSRSPRLALGDAKPLSLSHHGK